jgi:hypothetical protein
MSWQGQMSAIVRNLINDLDGTNYKYSPKRIENTILVASHLVLFDTSFNSDYSVNVEKCELSPDPTETEPKDTDFIVLTCLRTACIIIGSEVRTEASNAISIKDGPSAIDLRGVAGTLSLLYKDLCAKYEDALDHYKRDGVVAAGQAILGPYSPGSDFVIRHYSKNDRDGYYFRY